MASKRFKAAALKAELATGEKEETVEEARSHILVRIARITAGSLILFMGLLMMVLPGPGLLAIAAGLGILSIDVVWADRLLRYFRRKVPGVPEDGRIPRSAIVVGVVLLLGGVAASAWWFGR
ncbi:MAG: PGPGW domain-containing protein [Acidimicrobiales bacterium]